MTDTPSPLVLVSSGAPFLDAAAWVGSSCWLELAVHRALTEWLRDEADPELVPILWSVRAHRSELAEGWHARLPELRELPRSGFVEPDDQVEAIVGGFADLSGSVARQAATSTALAQMGDRYRDRQTVTVGPADGPTARTLRQAVAVTDDDIARLRQVPLSRT